MKRITIGLIIVFIFLMGLIARAQDCKVSIPSLNNKYTGDCKKGLAHGTGIAEGESIVYEGEFRKGYPPGEGTLKFKDGRIFNGEWKSGTVYGYGELTNTNGVKQSGYFKGTIDNFRFMGEDKSSLQGYKIENPKHKNRAASILRCGDVRSASEDASLLKNWIY